MSPACHTGVVGECTPLLSVGWGKPLTEADGDPLWDSLRFWCGHIQISSLSYLSPGLSLGPQHTVWWQAWRPQGYEFITVLILPFSGVNLGGDTISMHFKALPGGKCPREDWFLNAKEFALLIKTKQKSLHNEVTPPSAAVPSSPRMASIQLKCNRIKGISELYDNDCTQH